MSDKRRILTNTFANAAAQIVAMAASFAFLPLLTRRFGIAQYGLYMLAMTVASYSYLLDLGVGATLRKRVAEAEALGDRAQLSNLVSSTLAFYFMVGAATAVSIAGVGLAAGSVFRVGGGDALLLRNLLFVAAVQSLLVWPLSTATHVLAGLQRDPLLARTSLVSTVLQVAAMTGVLVMNEGPLAMLAVVATVSVIAGIANWILARKELGSVEITVKRMSWPTLKAIFVFSWPLIVSQICAFVVYQQTDRIVLAAFVGAAAVGLYEAAGKFQGLVSQVVGFANSAVMPMASSLEARQEHDRIAALFVRGTKYTLAVSLPLTLSLIVFAKPLVLHWLGPAFASVVLPAQLIVSHQLLSAGLTVGGNIAIGRGALKERVPYMIAVAVENLVLSLVLVRYLGILGVVLGTVVPYYLDFPFGLRFVLKHSGVPVRRWLRDVVLPTYPWLAVAGAVGAALWFTPLVHTLIGTLAAAGCMLAAYWALFLLAGLSASERLELLAATRALRARMTRRG
jgi:O-antigen/teichoic acid export membrane protein